MPNEIQYVSQNSVRVSFSQKKNYQSEKLLREIPFLTLLVNLWPGDKIIFLSTFLFF